LQTRLTVSQPDDPYEREADRVAERVMRMPVPAVQRKCTACEEEDKVLRLQRRPVGLQRRMTVSQPDDPYEQEADRVAAKVMQTQDPMMRRKCATCEVEEKRLHRKPGNTLVAPVAAAVDAATMAGGGLGLDATARAFFEPRFGADFSHVRVHADAQAARASEAVNARAFTLGRSIYFAAGEYRPHSDGGRRLLAHELTHVVQQRGTGEDVWRAARSAPVSRGAATPASRLTEEAPPESRTPELGRGRSVKRAPPTGLPCVVAPEPGHFAGVNVLFGRASALLTGGDRAAVARFAATWVSQGSRDLVRVDGYASVEGPEAYNLRLSCQRAESVKHELIGLGVAPNKITTVAHGESLEFSPRTLPPNRRAIISEGGRRIPPPVKPGPRHPSACGSIDDFFRTVLLIDRSLLGDIVTCVCLGTSIADAIPIPTVGQNPYVEAADCLCNVLTLLQEVYKRGSDGGCWSPSKISATDAVALTALAGITAVDCFSLPLGTAVGGFILGLIGTEAEPGGGTVVGGITGAVLGDMIVDLAAMATQNLITQGTPLPVAQLQACGRLVSRLAGRRPSRPPQRPSARQFVCGPNVTAQIAKALTDTRTLFRGWSAPKQAQACEALVRPPQAAFAWDILNLHRNRWILWYRCAHPTARCPEHGTNEVCATEGATPPCGSTVQVGTDCYYAGSANYVVFGVMCKLCRDRFPSRAFWGGMRFTEPEMVLLVDLYKAGGLAGENVGPAKAWARAGYRGWPSGGSPPPGDKPNCRPACPTPYQGSDWGRGLSRDFEITWCPNTPFVWGECKSEAGAWESIVRAITGL